MTKNHYYAIASSLACGVSVALAVYDPIPCGIGCSVAMGCLFLTGLVFR